MMAQFFDRQDTKNSLNGMRVGSSTELRQLLDRLRDREPFFAELIGENGFKLLLGIGSSEACVQFSAADGSAPYLMAVEHDAGAAEGETEFLIGDTASPVPKRYALSCETMVRIAGAFVDSGERHAGVVWEEV